MKTPCFKLSDRLTTGKRLLTAAACLFSAVLTSSATVTVQGWWHLDNAQPINDSSGNSRTFNDAYSTAYAAGGSVKAVAINNGAGGPLGKSGWTSTECDFIGEGANGVGKAQDTMWAIAYNPPAQNFGIELWVLPQDNGIAGGTGGWIFSSGSSGGVALRINAPSGNPSYIDAFDVGNHSTIGDQALIDTNRWMHLAIVNDGGVTTFYTNGVACGQSVTNATTTSGGDVYAFGAPGDNQAFYGYADEMRMFTFSPGAFSTNDLLLRPAGPIYINPPQSVVVWDGGAATFSAIASFDNSLSYQWRSNGASIAGATASTHLLPTVALAESGDSYDCILTLGGLSVTSTPAAILTVVPVNAANVAAYQSLVKSNSSLLAYFPVDGCTTSTLTNVADATHNGLLENNASYDGQTNRSFGQRALSFNADGDVEVQNNPAYEFPKGFGTIEAMVYLSGATVGNAAIFSEDSDGNPLYYSLMADSTGSFLIYDNDNSAITNTGTALTWPVPGGLTGRFLHIALVFDNLTNVTPYVDGQSLGTEVQGGFGSIPGGSFWMGGIGNSTTGNRWAGTIDEVAIYGTNLSAATIQTHYTKFFYGTNVAPPAITSQPGSKTMLAGGSPALTVTVGGALPFTFQWTSNAVPILGATTSTLVLPQTTTNSSATYSLVVSNVFGSTNTAPIVLTFLAPPAGYLAQVMKDNPTALWRLAETNGPTAVDSAGLNDAIYTTSGVTHGAGGFPGDPSGGALFDGVSGGAVTPANDPDLNPNGPFTIEFWGSLASYGFFVPLGSMPRPSRTGGFEYYIDGNSPGYEFHTAAGGGYNMLCGDGNVPPDGTWAYVTGVWDTTNLYLYVDGTLGNYPIDTALPPGIDSWQAEGTPPFNPNTSAPFIMGFRDDNSHYYHGTLSDVAFYNYALTPAQISNHWTYGWVASRIVATPPGVTNVEDSTVTLTPTVAGVPNTYQWFFGSTALSDAVNSDGSAHYPNDVTNLSLVISQSKPTDSGQYHLVVSNPLGGSVSPNITVLITPNTNPPTLVEVAALGTPNQSGPTPYLVKVVFSARVDSVTGADPTKYVFTPPLTISSMKLLGSGQYDVAAASLGADWREAILVTTGLTPGQKYSLTVTGVKDQSQTPVTMPPTTKAFRAPVLAAGAIGWDYYYCGSTGNAVSALLSDVNYPNAPQTNSYFTAFDSDQITGGDLNNNPAFGAIGDNYGDVTSGWITPTVSGDYTFFLWSDDGSELDLSTDSNPANATMIAEEINAGSGFVEVTNTAPPELDSSPVTLVAGHSYYIRALHAEGNGGDYIKIAWRISTDTTPASHLTPIPGAVLSSYQPVAAPQFSAPVLSGGNVTLNWSGQGTIQQSADLINWSNVTGNPNPLVVPVNSAKAMFYRIVQ